MDLLTGLATGLSVTASSSEPVTLDQAKAHLRVEVPDDDLPITALIAAARDLTEAYTGRLWVSRGATATYAGFPGHGCGGGEFGGWRHHRALDTAALRLPLAPVSSVGGVGYTAADGTPATLTGFEACLTRDPPLVGPGAGQWWPAVQPGLLAPVTVTFTAGYGNAAAVPPRAVQAILLTIGYWYERRGDTPDPAAAGYLVGLPAGAVRLLDSLRRKEYR